MRESTNTWLGQQLVPCVPHPRSSLACDTRMQWATEWNMIWLHNKYQFAFACVWNKSASFVLHRQCPCPKPRFPWSGEQTKSININLGMPTEIWLSSLCLVVSCDTSAPRPLEEDKAKRIIWNNRTRNQCNPIVLGMDIPLQTHSSTIFVVHLFNFVSFFFVSFYVLLGSPPSQRDCPHRICMVRQIPGHKLVLFT